jgi:hypothetical protein
MNRFEVGEVCVFAVATSTFFQRYLGQEVTVVKVGPWLCRNARGTLGECDYLVTGLPRPPWAVEEGAWSMGVGVLWWQLRKKHLGEEPLAMKRQTEKEVEV